MAICGFPKAAATCINPELLLTKKDASRMSAQVSDKDNLDNTATHFC